MVDVAGEVVGRATVGGIGAVGVYSDDVFANVIINEESALSDDSELEIKASIGGGSRSIR